MILTHLTLTSFRSAHNVELQFGAPRVLLAGLNGSGKTSIRDAIQWTLLGYCRGTDGKGAGAEVLIPTGNGFKAAEVELGIAGIGKVRRTYAVSGGGAFSVEGFTGTSQVQQQGLLMKLNTTPAFLAAVLDSEVFLDLTHAEAKALVLSLLCVTIPITEDGKTKAYTLDELDVRYKQAFEDRKIAKRLFMQAVLPAKPEAAQIPSLEAIDAQLHKLREALGVAQQRIGATVARRRLLTTQREQQTVTDIGPDQGEAIAALEAELAQMEEQVVPAPAEPTPGDPTRARFLRSRLEAIRAYLPGRAGCVLDSRIDCKTPDKQFQMAAGAIEKEMAALEPSAPVRPVESPLTALRKRLAELQAQQQYRETVLQRQAEEQTKHEAIEAELATLPDTAHQEAEIAEFQKRIGNGEALRQRAQTYWAQQATYTKAVEQRQRLEADVKRLEDLCEQLGPNGARAQALSTAMSVFEQAVNAYLLPFGWTLSFSIEPWDVLANGRPVETYSRSERYRIGIGLQLAIAQLSGLNFAVVDEIDMLDVGNRGILSKMLMEAKLDQILILGTREPAQTLPKVKGTLAYRLRSEKGRTVVAERSSV